jgi:predicted nucleic acid-binding protein
MAAVARYLADTSALARLHHPEVAAVLAPLIESGVVATCGVIEFELRWATRSSAELDQVRADRDAGYEWLATHDEDWRRALDVQAALWRSGRIRAVGLPDLLIAAVAERERVTVLHYDGDYELIAQVTGQPVQWVAQPGQRTARGRRVRTSRRRSLLAPDVIIGLHSVETAGSPAAAAESGGPSRTGTSRSGRAFRRVRCRRRRSGCRA